MRTEEFDYYLPKELIAQHPERERTASRLLILNRSTGGMEHGHFAQITDYFHAGDVLVLNDSKVFPARLPARKKTGGRVELLLVERKEERKWDCLVKGVKPGAGDSLVFVGEAALELSPGDSFWTVRIPEGTDLDDLMAKHGTMPLPPYVKRVTAGDPEDFDRYQTVYAEPPGSIAAPTAGFHFTGELLERLEQTGVTIVKVTLHIGVGTFFLIKTGLVEDHGMHREFYSLSPETKDVVRRAKEEGRRVVACGTSAVRTLETAYSGNGSTPLAGYTPLFIYPGYRFKVVDGLITNFHLPRSTPLLLVSAFAGKDMILRAYKEAMEMRYRFYSYGDAMLIV
jgi:S-adenosylmethionine:tRNA ribosyltransferase-isomerase